jgi:VanZ family protein
LAKASSPLQLYLAVAYTLLAIYGSLYPFSDWHDSGAPLTAFLEAGWPRYTTAFDLGLNLAAYLPLGFLWVTALQPRLTPLLAVIAAAALGAGLALALETLQNFLPSRVPSNLDLGCNATGALVGALLGARWGTTMLDGGRLHALRHQLFRHGRTADAGLMLLWLWLLTQFNPDTLLFGNGDLRYLLGLPAAMPYTAEGFPSVEAAIVGSHLLAVALMAGLLCRPGHALVVGSVLAAALTAKSFAFLLIMNGANGLAWATPGSLAGLGGGLLLWLLASPLPLPWRRAFAALALLVATALVNVAPENPYLANTFQVWNPGQFLNFHGLTRLASNLWPFLALPWLMLMRTDHDPRHP